MRAEHFIFALFVFFFTANVCLASNAEISENNFNENPLILVEKSVELFMPHNSLEEQDRVKYLLFELILKIDQERGNKKTGEKNSSYSRIPVALSSFKDLYSFDKNVQKEIFEELVEYLTAKGGDQKYTELYQFADFLNSMNQLYETLDEADKKALDPARLSTDEKILGNEIRDFVFENFKENEQFKARYESYRKTIVDFHESLYKKEEFTQIPLDSPHLGGPKNSKRYFSAIEELYQYSIDLFLKDLGRVSLTENRGKEDEALVDAEKIQNELKKDSYSFYFAEDLTPILLERGQKTENLDWFYRVKLSVSGTGRIIAKIKIKPVVKKMETAVVVVPSHFNLESKEFLRYLSRVFTEGGAKESKSGSEKFPSNNIHRTLDFIKARWKELKPGENVVIIQANDKRELQPHALFRARPKPISMGRVKHSFRANAVPVKRSYFKLAPLSILAEVFAVEFSTTVAALIFDQPGHSFTSNPLDFLMLYTAFWPIFMSGLQPSWINYLYRGKTWVQNVRMFLFPGVLYGLGYGLVQNYETYGNLENFTGFTVASIFTATLLNVWLKSPSRTYGNYLKNTMAYSHNWKVGLLGPRGKRVNLPGWMDSIQQSIRHQLKKGGMGRRLISIGSKISNLIERTLPQEKVVYDTKIKVMDWKDYFTVGFPPRFVKIFSYTLAGISGEEKGSSNLPVIVALNVVLRPVFQLYAYYLGKRNLRNQTLAGEQVPSKAIQILKDVGKKWYIKAIDASIFSMWKKNGKVLVVHKGKEKKYLYFNEGEPHQADEAEFLKMREQSLIQAELVDIYDDAPYLESIDYVAYRLNWHKRFIAQLRGKASEIVAKMVVIKTAPLKLEDFSCAKRFTAP